MKKKHIHWYGEICYLYIDDLLYKLNEEQSFIINLLINGYNYDEIVDRINREYVNLNNPEINNILKIILNELNEYYSIHFKSIQDISTSGLYHEYFPFALTIHLTEICHFKCKHCYKSDNELKTIEVSKLYAFLNKIKGKTKNITFTGGEPLLYNGLSGIVNDFSEYFNFTLVTSGFSLEKINFQNYNEVQLSLYGYNKESYEQFTKYIGSFKVIDEALDVLVSSNTNLKVTYVPRTVVFDDIDMIVKYCIQKGVKTLQIGELFEMGSALINYVIDDDFKIKIRNNVSQIIKKYYSEINIVYDLNESKLNSDRKYFSCGAGDLHCNIMSNGDCLPCSIFNETKFIIFNIYTVNIDDIFKENNFDRLCGRLEENLSADENISMKSLCAKSIS